MDNKKKISSRRDFLTVGMTGDRSKQSADDAEANLIGQRKQGYLETYSKNAMACEFQLLFNMQQYGNSGDAALKVFELIDTYEDQLSVYRSDSEVSRLNRTGCDDTVTVQENLYELLTVAEAIFKRTNGAFDITSTPLSKAWGFHNRDANVPTDEEIAEALRLVDGNQVKLLPDNGIRIQHEGIGINLGGIGKGYTLDRAADLLASCGIGDFVLHGGQSSVVAHGNDHGKTDADIDDTGWMIGISHPLVPEQRLAKFQLLGMALGTSGTGRQGFFHNGKRYGHIIDPRTGWPTDHFLSTTVICNSAAEADALATAFFVMDLDAVQSYCDDHPEIKTVIVRAGSGSKPIIESFNMDGIEWTICS